LVAFFYYDMFKRLKKIAKNASTLELSTPSNKNAIFTKTISKSEVKRLVLQLNRVEQLFRKGIDADGKVFGRYAASTEERNERRSFNYGGFNQIKQEGKPIILYDSGDFYKSFNVRIYNDGFTIIANDEKDNGILLAEVYGKKILGLTTTSKNELSKFIKPIIIQEVRKQIFK
jgi:hypothetical protein